MTEATRTWGPYAGRLRLDLAYDGSGFRGWSTQPGLRTVQGVLTEAIDRHPPAGFVTGIATCAGRTDAGVHARGQVAHLDLYRATVLDAEPGLPDPELPDQEMPDPELLGQAVRRWRRALPADVSLRTVAPAPPDFDARFSAVWRRYGYRVADAAAGVDPLVRGFVLGYPRPLDLDRLNRAAQSLLGEHDFAAFCRRKPDGTTIRRLLGCSAAREGDGTVALTFRADAFCQQMVRSLVGALLPVADGTRDPDWPAQLLATGVRAVQLAPPHGLCLEEVGYPPDDQLAARSRVTRSVRMLPASGAA